MKKPNFFIIGAPKSGTTALSEYLRTHPRAFISPHKEPNFWNDDFRQIATVKSLREYERLFKDAGPQHIAVGEASVHYLRSTTAVPRIIEYNPEAKFIVLLRNPVDLVHAWHSQNLYGLWEDEPDFARAWNLQEERAAGRHIPKTCLEPKVLMYRQVGALGSQVARLFENVAREKVRLYVFDDFNTNPAAVYRDLLAFLGLPDDGRELFPRVNENKRQRHAVIARFVERPPRLWQAGAKVLRIFFRKSSLGLLQRLRRWNQQPVGRPPISAEFRKQLLDAFDPEIRRLAVLLDRNLDHWRETNRPSTTLEQRVQAQLPK